MTTNWSGNVVLNAREFQPTTPGSLGATLAQALASGQKMRGLAGKYSTSHAMAPAVGGRTLSVKKLTLDPRPGEASVPMVAPFASRGPASWYRASTAGLVQISAGATIDQVNRYLTSQGRSLPMMGAFSGQTFVGAMLTGTHGTAATIGPLADLVVSLDVVTIDAGQVVRYRIERSNGPTHADHYEAGTGTRVLHDDDLFSAFAVSFGYLGIITSVVVRTLPLFRLRHSGQVISWQEVKNRLADANAAGVPDRVNAAYGVSVTMSPYRASGEQAVWPTCIWNEVLVSTAPITQRPGPSPLIPGAALAPHLLGLQRDDQLPAAVDVVLRSTVESSPRVDIAHKILASPSPYAVKGYGLEFGFPITPDLRYITAIEQFLRRIAELETGTPRRYLAGFFTLRFVKASSAYLAQTYDPTGNRVFCILEVLAAGAAGQPEVILPSLIDVGLAQGGRVHWGQIFDVGPNLGTLSSARIRQALSSHPGYARWKPHFERFNQSGTFDNPVGDLFP